jgi:aryl-alcohol dehydrogenase-like predicted oxidoreductase
VEVRRLGASGLKVSRLGLGTMTFGLQSDRKTSFQILDRAVAAGVSFIDTADVYPLGRTRAEFGLTEEILGEWLKGHRQEVVLATKCHGVMGPGLNDQGLGRKHIMEAVEASLRRLRTDYLDLYQAHQFDRATPLEETLRAFDDLIRQGKVRYVGVSNWPAYQVQRSLAIADRRDFDPLVSVQPRYNLLYRAIETELVPLCREAGVGIIAYNPLAGGFLTGRYRRGQEVEPGTRFALGGIAKPGERYRGRYWNEAAFAAVETFRTFCANRGWDMATTAVRWVMHQPGVSVALIGASRPDQLEQSLAASALGPLGPEELQELDDLWYQLPRQKVEE